MNIPNQDFTIDHNSKLPLHVQVEELFRKLIQMEVYKKALQFGVKVYKLTLTNQQIAKDFGLKDQLQRAVLSISNNIAEGFERETKKELIHFLYISKGSAGECRNMFNFLQML